MFLRGELDNPTSDSSNGGSNKDKEDGGGGKGGGVAPWSRATKSSMSGGLGNIGRASNPGSKNHASSNLVSLHDIIMAEQKEKQQQQLGAGGSMYKKTHSSNTPPPTSGGGLVKKKMTLAAFIGSGGKTDDQPQSSAWGNTGVVGNNAGAPLSTVTISAAAIGASPPACITPLRRIQDEQLAASLGVGVVSGDRMTMVPPFRSPSPSRGFSSAAIVPTNSSSTMIGGLSKWYVPDEQHPPPIKSLKAIQAEESAVQQLEKKFGAGNVRVASSRR
jgi:hypothetical protein